VRLVTVVPHTGAWECRVGLLQANLSISGPPSGETRHAASTVFSVAGWLNGWPWSARSQGVPLLYLSPPRRVWGIQG
jgi:hypothetical protein